jgi:hypothetical protein
MARPTALAKPWPRGPVVTSMPITTLDGVLSEFWRRTIGMASFGVTWCLGVDLTEGFQIIHGELVSEKMKENVLECTSA